VATFCDHAIFDYGTFGFWGAYLQQTSGGSHVVTSDDIGKVNMNWAIQSMKEANITHWTFIHAFVDEASL
jgi:hypothetical protein